MATCVACGAPIDWRDAEKGQRLPFDTHPSMRGENRYAEGDDGLMQAVAPDADVLAWPDHRTTCAVAQRAARR